MPDHRMYFYALLYGHTCLMKCMAFLICLMVGGMQSLKAQQSPVTKADNKQLPDTSRSKPAMDTGQAMGSSARPMIKFQYEDTFPAPPPEKPRIVQPKDDSIFFTGCDEVEARFRGGSQRWQRFLQRYLSYPAAAYSKKIQGSVVLIFIVCEDGSVCDIEATKGPEELRQPAIEALKKTPKWIPATRGGKKVRSYKSQPIVFRL